MGSARLAGLHTSTTNWPGVALSFRVRFLALAGHLNPSVQLPEWSGTCNGDRVQLDLQMPPDCEPEIWVSASAAGRLIGVSHETMRLWRDSLVPMLGGRVRQTAKQLRVDYPRERVLWYARERSRRLVGAANLRRDFDAVLTDECVE